MSNFIKPINYDGQVYEFSFARIQTINGPKYFVMVDDSTREYHFIIEKCKEEWVLNDAPMVPQWIHDIERLLIEAIVQNEKSI